VISKKPKAEEIIMAEISKKDILEVLKEFSEKNLDPKLTKIDQRFEQIDQRFGQMDQRMDGLDKKVDQFRDEIIHRFHVISEDVISQVKLVAEGIINFDQKFTREMTSLRKENEQAHEEIKAMIKFSYAELDRRISTLEIEVQELKRRMDQIERRSIS
jgi:archaellum component FlaC